MSGEKTEQPTQKRLRDARKKGQVAKSKEISSGAAIIGILIFLWLSYDYYLAGFQSMIIITGHNATKPFHVAFSVIAQELITIFMKLILPLFLVVILLDIASNFFQIGLLFSFQSIKPEIKKLNPTENIKRIVSKKNIIQLLWAIIKIVSISIILFIVLSMALPALVTSLNEDEHVVMSLLGYILKKFIAYTSMVFVTLAAVDYFFQKRQHIKELMMTKDEVKREYKEMEGDPHIKSHRRQLHLEMSTRSMLQNVRKATVVVTNPNHRAIALFYDKEKTKLPIIVAKGEKILAERILAIAREENIPIMRDVYLARELYDKGQLEDYIPADLIEPVAEVLRWVYKIKMSSSA